MQECPAGTERHLWPFCRPCSVCPVLGLLQLHFLPWAARYNTWLLIKVDAERRSLFFSVSFPTTFPTFSCMACSGELPLTYVWSRHSAAISSRFCCQAQCLEPDVLCAVAANQSIAGSWRRCQSQPTVQGRSSSAGKMKCYNAACNVSTA